MISLRFEEFIGEKGEFGNRDININFLFSFEKFGRVI